MTNATPVVGVLALQGSFAEHRRALGRLGAESVEIRLPEHLNGLAGLIIPGGESTTILKLIDEYGLRGPMCAAVSAGLTVLGTCAGAVCLATEISSHRMKPLGLLDIAIARNAFGRQVESFEEDLPFSGLVGPSFRGVFIRAPIIERCGRGVEVLARVSNGSIVACRQDAILVTSFHPEFVDDLRVHQYFLSIVAERTGMTRPRCEQSTAAVSESKTVTSATGVCGRG